MADQRGDPDIREVPAPGDRVHFAAGFAPRFVVTVDTEEEFDWTKPLARTGHGLAHVPALGRFQEFCENQRVVPVYLIDYPVACDPRTVDLLGPAIAAGRADFGMQLHPWVSPPFDEHVNNHNSYAGNLPAALEAAKFDGLLRTIEAVFGRRPCIYRAGRYGVGANTARILAEGGMAIDSSVRAGFNYASQGGADFRNHPVHPWWIDRARGLFELPLTTLYCGRLRRHGAWLHAVLWRTPRLRGVLARLGLLERVPLTPEGVDIRAALRAIDMALADAVPVLVFSFHSPSLMPGHTPYVRDDAALDRLYDWWRAVFAHLRTRGIAPASLSEITTAARG